MKSFTYYDRQKVVWMADVPLMLIDIIIILLYYFHILLIGWTYVFIFASILLHRIWKIFLKKRRILYSVGTYELSDNTVTIKTRFDKKIPLNQITKIYAERQKKSGQNEYVLKYLHGKKILFQTVSEPVTPTETFFNTDLYQLCIDTVSSCDSINVEKSHENLFLWSFSSK